MPNTIPRSTVESTRICMHVCRARCCRGPLVLRLAEDELPTFEAHAAALGAALHLRRGGDGSGAIRFLEHPGARCPMLDAATSACRIYDDRPRRCRAFPDAPRPDCAISRAR